jgi:hypothetical protein
VQTHAPTAAGPFGLWDRWPWIHLAIAGLVVAGAAATWPLVLDHPAWLWFFVLPIPILALHEWEEFVLPGGFARWFNLEVCRSDDPWRPYSRQEGARQHMPLMVLYPLLALLGTRWPWIGLAGIFALLADAMFHLSMTAVWRRYSPGTVTALLLYFPLGFAATHRFVAAGEINMVWLLVAAFGGVAGYNIFLSLPARSFAGSAAARSLPIRSTGPATAYSGRPLESGASLPDAPPAVHGVPDIVARVLGGAVSLRPSGVRGRQFRLFRVVIVVAGVLTLLYAAALFLQQPWATGLWLWPDQPALGNIFVASILAAIALPVLWIGWSGELGAARGGALNLMVSFAGLSAHFLTLAVAGGGSRFWVYAAVALLAVPINIAVFMFVRRMPLLDPRPAPEVVRWSFGVFALILIAVGVALLRAVPGVWPWHLSPEVSVVHGWFFLGASAYFLYGFLWPSWANAKGQLLGFLAYDAVLAVPYLEHLRHVLPEHRLSLSIYLVVIGYSGLLAVWYLILRPAGRSRTRRTGPDALHREVEIAAVPGGPRSPASGLSSRSS